MMLKDKKSRIDRTNLIKYSKGTDVVVFCECIFSIDKKIISIETYTMMKLVICINVLEIHIGNENDEMNNIGVVLWKGRVDA